VASIARRDGRGSTAQGESLRVRARRRDAGRGHFRSGLSTAPRTPRSLAAAGLRDPDGCLRSRDDWPTPDWDVLVGFSARRCHRSRVTRHIGLSKSTGTLAAAQDPSVISIRYLPNILSGFRWQNRRQVSPSLVLGSGEPRWQNSWPPHRAAGNNLASLRPTRTLPPLVGDQPSFRRTHRALPGATGVDSKTGAAIHRPVAPGESA